jgi:hypothetical protein
VSPYSERVYRDLKSIGKVLTKLNLGPFFFLVEVDNQISVLGRQRFETAVEAYNARVLLHFLSYFLAKVMNRVVESDRSVLPISPRLQVNHSRHSVKITLEVVDALTLVDPAGDAIYRLVGMFVCRVDPSPFEKADEFAPHRFILRRCLIAIRRKRIQEFLESVMR